MLNSKILLLLFFFLQVDVQNNPQQFSESLAFVHKTARTVLIFIFIHFINIISMKNYIMNTELPSELFVTLSQFKAYSRNFSFSDKKKERGGQGEGERKRERRRKKEREEEKKGERGGERERENEKEKERTRMRMRKRKRKQGKTPKSCKILTFSPWHYKEKKEKKQQQVRYLVGIICRSTK